MDVCTGFCSVAVLNGDVTLAARHEPMKRGHVERLAPMVAEVLDEAELTPADLGSIAVTTGPGSFTGARLGVSFARGLALALSIPTVGVSIFEAMRADETAPAIVALPGKNGSVLLQRFTADGMPLAAPAEFDADTAVQIVPDTETFTVIASEVNAKSIARLGTSKLAAGTVTVPTPLYVRQADAKPQLAVNLGG